MQITLVTLESYAVTTLHPMLVHYAKLGVTKILIYAQESPGRPELLDEIHAIAAKHRNTDVIHWIKPRALIANP